MTMHTDTVAVEQAILINKIIDAYHTTRLSEVPVSAHILSKSYVRAAFARLAALQHPGGGVEDLTDEQALAMLSEAWLPDDAGYGEDVRRAMRAIKAAYKFGAASSTALHGPTVEACAKIADASAVENLRRSDELRQSEDPIDIEYSVAFHRKHREAAAIASSLRALPIAAGEKCGDCPPAGYPTDKTRCAPCPLRSTAEAGEEAKSEPKGGDGHDVPRTDPPLSAVETMRAALQNIADAPAWGYPERWETTPAEVRQLARDALAALALSPPADLAECREVVELAFLSGWNAQETGYGASPNGRLEAFSAYRTNPSIFADPENGED